MSKSKERNFKLNILGTEYDVIMGAKETDYPNLERGDGYVDYSIKQIVIAEFEPDDYSLADLKSYEQKVLRHEIVHAFMHESGLDICSEWGRNETLVDYIALQIPKMIKAMTEAGALNVLQERTHTITTAGGTVYKVDDQGQLVTLGGMGLAADKTSLYEGRNIDLIGGGSLGLKWQGEEVKGLIVKRKGGQNES